MKRTIRDLVNLKGKVVLVRVDFNVPIDDNGKILDYRRINEAVPTIKYLVNKGAKVVLISHLGRPKGFEIRKSLWPISLYLLKYFPNRVFFSNTVIGEETKGRIAALKEGSILLLENVRFYKEEELCDKKFAKELASLGDLFVNDAFGVSHRKHASVYELARLMPNAIGFLMERELENLSRLLDKSRRPFIAVIGGAKVKDKIKLLKALANKADALLLGGAMAYTFLVADGVAVGESITYPECVVEAKEILDYARENGKKIYLPIDHVAKDTTKEGVKPVVVEQLSQNLVGFDIGPKTVKLYSAIIKKARQVFWNGPLGMYEQKPFDTGTNEVAKAIASSRAYSFVGGGDSLSAIKACKLEGKIDYLSTGGGASLNYIEEGSLPCIEVIQEKIQ